MLRAPMTGAERTVLPLFPLNTVLFPGLVLPLRVFEDRYRALVRTLLERPDPAQRTFGVVAIRRGWEVSQPVPGAGTASPAGQAGSVEELYDVGCTAEIRDVTEHPDGTYDIVTVGRRRYAIAELITAPTPYAQASVTYLPEHAGPDGDADALGPQVLLAFRAYLRAFRAAQAGRGGASDASDEEQLPGDPLVLSHLVAASASLRLADRQALLAAPDTASRLREELRLLHQERWLLNRIRAVPATVADLPFRPAPN
jgi:Lon protease-like protein